MTSTIQTADELNSFYTRPDPWDYTNNPDDTKRRNELLSLLPSRIWERTLDIGCGDGFVTFSLPGKKVIGIDLSQNAIQWADRTRISREDSERFEFATSSLFELDAERLSGFDLIVITGVLYPQYIGHTFSVVREIIDKLLLDGGYLFSCHIDEWTPPRFPYPLIDTSLYPYRGHTHRLEVYRK